MENANKFINIGFNDEIEKLSSIEMFISNLSRMIRNKAIPLLKHNQGIEKAKMIANLVKASPSHVHEGNSIMQRIYCNLNSGNLQNLDKAMNDATGFINKVCRELWNGKNI